MLLPDLYAIKHFEFKDGILQAQIEINSTHDIFRGHFPDNPILPGVCSLQIVKELTEKATNKNLVLAVASNVKFMAVINPKNTPSLRFNIAITELHNSVKVKNTTFFEDTKAINLSAHYNCV